jgi:hypothetical protein
VQIIIDSFTYYLKWISVHNTNVAPEIEKKEKYIIFYAKHDSCSSDVNEFKVLISTVHVAVTTLT